MHRLLIKTDFPYFHGGYARRDYVAGEEIATEDAEFATVAVAEKWAEDLDAVATTETDMTEQKSTQPPAPAPAPAAKRAKKAHDKAPENKGA